jgi:MFS family permease
MFKACVHPLFLLMVVCMLMTASTELGINQWIPTILGNLGISSILVLVWINGVMAVGRSCAGTIVHRLSPLGTLLCSAALSAVGLYAMSKSSGAMVYVVATVFAMGVCFFWPTMLGYVNEKFPSTGALGLAIMGGAGMLATNFALPIIGKFYDDGIAARIPAGQTTATLAAAPDAAPWMKIQADAGLAVLQKIGVLPVTLFVIFLILYLTRPKAKAQQAPGAAH